MYLSKILKMLQLTQKSIQLLPPLYLQKTHNMQGHELLPKIQCQYFFIAHRETGCFLIYFTHKVVELNGFPKKGSLMNDIL